VASCPFQPFAGLPVSIGFVRAPDALLAEHVRMAPNHFLPRRGQQRLKRGPAGSFRDQREEQDAVEDVTKFSLQLIVMMGANGFKHLPGFLDQVGQEGGDCLSPVPGATPRSLEPLGGGDKVPKRVAAASLDPAVVLSGVEWTASVSSSRRLTHGGAYAKIHTTDRQRSCGRYSNAGDELAQQTMR